MRSKHKKPLQTKSPPKTIFDLAKYVVLWRQENKKPAKSHQNDNNGKTNINNEVLRG